MTIALRYAIRSDVGLLREGNEDSAYAGPHLLAIADGMGGHAAGEVASSVAISALAGLDSDVPVDRMLDSLAAAVAAFADAKGAIMAHRLEATVHDAAKQSKVFWFFFSKKNERKNLLF